MKELTITKGSWTVKWHNGLAHVFSANLMSICRIDNCFDKETADANAQLIAEAGTVANQCGLTPKELLEQRDALVKYAKALLENQLNSHIKLIKIIKEIDPKWTETD